MNVDQKSGFSCGLQKDSRRHSAWCLLTRHQQLSVEVLVAWAPAVPGWIKKASTISCRRKVRFQKMDNIVQALRSKALATQRIHKCTCAILQRILWRAPAVYSKSTKLHCCDRSSYRPGKTRSLMPRPAMKIAHWYFWTHSYDLSADYLLFATALHNLDNMNCDDITRAFVRAGDINKITRPRGGASKTKMLRQKRTKCSLGDVEERCAPHKYFFSCNYHE